MVLAHARDTREDQTAAHLLLSSGKIPVAATQLHIMLSTDPYDILKYFSIKYVKICVRCNRIYNSIQLGGNKTLKNFEILLYNNVNIRNATELYT